MKSPNQDCVAISNRIVFDGQMETVLQRHTGLICWTDDESSPVLGVKNNGTFCFVQTGECRFLLTCSHVWRGFKESQTNETCLWISLIRDDVLKSPVIPFLARNPTLIEEDTKLDLATLTFDGINSLDAWRFHRRSHLYSPRVTKGSPVCFIGYPGDGLREGQNFRSLNYSLFAFTVHETSHSKFLIHDKADARQLHDKNGKPILPMKISGVSGAPIFSFNHNLKMSLAGVVCEVSSPGLSGCVTSPEYELSDGDIYATYADFIQDNGSIRAS